MKTTSLVLTGAAALPLVLGAALGGRRGEPVPAIPAITVTATDYALELPDALQAGAIAFAGRYALICFIPDAKDGKAHFEHGMVQEIAVARAVSALTPCPRVSPLTDRAGTCP